MQETETCTDGHSEKYRLQWWRLFS